MTANAADHFATDDERTATGRRKFHRKPLSSSQPELHVEFHREKFAGKEAVVITPSDPMDAVISSPDRFERPPWFRRLTNARFLTISLVAHILLVLTFGTKALFNKYVEPPDFTGEPGSFLNDAPPQAQVDTPPPEQPMTPTVTPNPIAPNIQAITTTAPTLAEVTIPTLTPPTISPTSTLPSNTNAPPPPPPSATGLTKELAVGIAGFTAGWSKPGASGPGSALTSREFQFTAYLAKYAGGDWNSTVQMQGNTISHGSLPNLLYVMSKLSRDKIKGQPEAIPLDLASEDIFAKKPPFIWFTGHRDFVLTDKEVENLQKYIRLGGCIWGDSSLPGRRSRFDIAFRREMRRVIPDVNKQWQELPKTHPIFTKGYFPDVRDVPPGINYYHEPIYVIESYGGEIGIIYTANDYGDMWQFGIDEKGQIDMRRDAQKKLIAMNQEMWNRHEIFYRNITPKALFDTFKFGTNIVVHLLTRWEDKVRNVPKGL